MYDDLNDIFNVSASNVLAGNKKAESQFYTPSADKGIDKVYNSQIKFITNIHNPAKSLIKKYTVWVENPDTEERKSIDCPSIIEGQKSILQDAFFELYYSSSAHDKKLSEGLKRADTYYSLVYIVKDEHNPSMEGKIKIFKFGKQLYEVLDSSVNDPDEPNDFLNFFEGKTLRLKIVEKSGYNNYSQSSFGNKVHFIKIDGEEMTDTPKNRKKLAEWLKTNSPDISDFGYKPWDEETRNFVIDALKAIIPNESMLAKIFKKSGISSNSPTKKSKKIAMDLDEDEVIKPSQSNVPKISNFNEDDEDEDEAPKVKQKAKPAAKKSNKKVVELDEDDEDEDDEDEELDLDDFDDSDLDEIDAHLSKVNKKTSKRKFDDDDDEEPF